MNIAKYVLISEARYISSSASPLVPSAIVETKRGYQAYWDAKDGTSAHWNAIVLRRLVPYFGADANARDIARILRVPGYYHLKNPADPFMVRIAHWMRVSYTERQIVEHWSEHVDEAEREREFRREVRSTYTPQGGVSGDDFWERVYNLDCEEGLLRLSGMGCVGGESFTFRPCRNGNLNLYVDGKGSSCWIDKSKRIGSLDRGGPTLANWLHWYGCSWADAARTLKDIFPHLEIKA